MSPILYQLYQHLCQLNVFEIARLTYYTTSDVQPPQMHQPYFNSFALQPRSNKKTLGSFFFHLTLWRLIVEDDGLWKTKENLLNEKGTPIYGFLKNNSTTYPLEPFDLFTTS